MTRILRGVLAHTPSSPFRGPGFEAFSDGGLVIREGRIVALGPFAEVRSQYPDAEVSDLREGVILPGFVDLHVHYPQVRIIGALGYRLLDWLESNTLPEEAKLADAVYARALARDFLRGLLRNGTTTALVFGSHFAAAMEVFFEEALASRLRILAGLVLSDRNLRPELHTTPQRAYQESLSLARKWHERGKLRYAVTPRFSLSCSEAILEVCQQIQHEVSGAFFTSHLNEMPEEIATVKGLFPWADSYCQTYDKFGLVSDHAVFAHNVYPQDAELECLASYRAAVAHCPCSNAFIGSGIFPLKAHLEAGVKFGLGTDVAGGTGFGILKEGLMAYLAQRLLPEGYLLTAPQLLYLATRAGAEALNLQDEIGDFGIGKAADLVYVKPPKGSSLEAVLHHAETPEQMLGALFTMASEADIAQVFVDGEGMLDPPKRSAPQG
ncbi:MAG TPA: guanine deaminase [Meiothermus sp.]|nr:guanine deaminase [Meiothermus sp.]